MRYRVQSSNPRFVLGKVHTLCDLFPTEAGKADPGTCRSKRSDGGRDSRWMLSCSGSEKGGNRLVKDPMPVAGDERLGVWPKTTIVIFHHFLEKEDDYV